MSGVPKRLKPEVAEAVTNYAVRLGELVDRCAEESRRDPETFLWNARRVLEVICHILQSVHKDEVSRDEGEAGNLEKRIQELRRAGLVERELATSLNAIRDYTNQGVHIRGPEKENYPLARKHVREQLPDVVDWLFDLSRAAHYLERPERLDAALLLLREPSRSADPQEAGRERTGEQGPPPEVTAQTVPAAPPSRARPPRRASWPRRLGLAFLLAVVCAGGLRYAGRPTANPAAAETSPAAAPTRAEVVLAPAAPALPSLRCPEGMVLLPETLLRLGPPEGGRTGWPTARTLVNTVRVGPSCLDAKARSWARFAEWGGPVGSSKDCDWRLQDREGPVVCLTRAEAGAYCEAKGLRLARIAEWELLQRHPELGAEPDRVREWVEDAFPPEDLGYAPDPGLQARFGLFRDKLAGATSNERAPRNSWNRQELGNRYKNLGFRCAGDPTAG